MTCSNVHIWLVSLKKFLWHGKRCFFSRWCSLAGHHCVGCHVHQRLPSERFSSERLPSRRWRRRRRTGLAGRRLRRPAHGSSRRRWRLRAGRRWRQAQWRPERSAQASKEALALGAHRERQSEDQHCNRNLRVHIGIRWSSALNIKLGPCVLVLISTATVTTYLRYHSAWNFRGEKWISRLKMENSIRKIMNFQVRENPLYRHSESCAGSPISIQTEHSGCLDTSAGNMRQPTAPHRAALRGVWRAHEDIEDMGESRTMGCLPRIRTPAIVAV